MFRKNISKVCVSETIHKMYDSAVAAQTNCITCKEEAVVILGTYQSSGSARYVNAMMKT